MRYIRLHVLSRCVLWSASIDEVAHAGLSGYNAPLSVADVISSTRVSRHAITTFTLWSYFLNAA